MPWEVRGQRAYYYRSCRRGRRTGRVYAGTGVAGEKAAAADAAERARREAQTREQKDALKQQQAVDALIGQAVAGTQLLLRAALLAEGFYQHQRGEWRRRRHGRPG
jgi:hypothetical protein